MTVRAVFENGVFRPLEPVALPEHSTVEFEPRPVSTTPRKSGRSSRLRQHIVSLGHATGLDNQTIDQDLSREASQAHDRTSTEPPL